MTYDSAGLYIETCSTKKARIVAVQTIIDALLTTAANAAAGDYISQYTLNDGQTIISCQYRGTKDIYTAIANFEKLKETYINQLHGRVFRAQDRSNFPPSNC